MNPLKIAKLATYVLEAKAETVIRAEGVTFTMASTPFLTDLTKAVQATGQPVSTLRNFLCAGAPNFATFVAARTAKPSRRRG